MRIAIGSYGKTILRLNSAVLPRLLEGSPSEMLPAADGFLPFAYRSNEKAAHCGFRSRCKNLNTTL